MKITLLCKECTTSFRTTRRNKTGLCSKCMRRDWERRNREAKPELYSRLNKKYRTINQEKVKERDKIYREVNSEEIKNKSKQYYWDNVEKERARGRELYAKNGEHRRKYAREWYQENAEEQKHRGKKRRDIIKSYFQELKKSLKCNRCPEDHPGCIVFHHIDSSTKEETISQMIGEGWSIKKIQEEIAKCEVLCANCHMKHHWQERQEKENYHESEQSKSAK